MIPPIHAHRFCPNVEISGHDEHVVVGKWYYSHIVELEHVLRLESPRDAHGRRLRTEYRLNQQDVRSKTFYRCITALLQLLYTTASTGS